MYLLMAPALCTCWILGAQYRHQLRTKYNLVQAPAEDWVLHLFCPCCALCQEYRELQNRGIDPSLGIVTFFFLGLNVLFRKKKKKDLMDLNLFVFLFMFAGWMGYLAQQQETQTTAPKNQSMDK